MGAPIPVILAMIRAGAGADNDPAPLTQGQANDLANAIDSLVSVVQGAWTVLKTEAHPQADTLFEALILLTNEQGSKTNG